MDMLVNATAIGLECRMAAPSLDSDGFTFVPFAIRIYILIRYCANLPVRVGFIVCVCHQSFSEDPLDLRPRSYAPSADGSAASLMTVQAHTSMTVSIALPQYRRVVCLRSNTLHPVSQPPFLFFSPRLSV